MEATRAHAAWTARVTLLTVLLVVVTLLGGWRVAASTSSRHDPSTLQLDGTTVRVTHVERVTGLTPEDLSGMSHGIQGLIQDDQTMLRVSVVISAGERATTYDAGNLLLRGAASPHVVRPVGGSVGRGTLGAHASIEGAVSFVVPRSGARYVLHAVGSPESVPLLKVDQAPRGAGHMDMGHDSPAQSHPSPARP